MPIAEKKEPVEPAGARAIQKAKAKNERLIDEGTKREAMQERVVR